MTDTTGHDAAAREEMDLERASGALQAAALQLRSAVASACMRRSGHNVAPELAAKLHSEWRAFHRETVANALRFNEGWANALSSAVENLRGPVEHLANMLVNPPPPTTMRGAAAMNAKTPVEAHGDVLSDDITGFMRTFLNPIHGADGARERARLARHRPQPLAIAGQAAAPGNVVNVLMNVLQFYQFNVTFNAAAFQERVRASVDRVEDPQAKAELLTLSTRLQVALAAGNKEEARATLAAFGDWLEKNPGKAGAIAALVSFLLSVLQMILA